MSTSNKDYDDDDDDDDDVIEYFAKSSHSSSLKVIENGIIRKLWYGFLLALHMKYDRITNVTDTQLATARRHRPRLCIASRG